jgi:hypothetical protein
MKTLLPVLWLAVFLLPCRGQQPWDGPALTGDPAAVLQAANAVVSPKGSNVHVLLEAQTYKYDPDGRITSTTRRIYKVLTPEGVDAWSSLSSTYSPWYQRQPRVSGRVITIDGKVHSLDPATFSEAPVKSDSDDVFTDRRSFRGPIPAVSVGAVVEWVIEDVEPLFPEGSAFNYVMGMQVPLLHERLEIDLPLGHPFRYEIKELAEISHRSAESNGRVQHIFEGGPFKPHKRTESHVPYDVYQRGQVIFTTGRNWQAVAAGYHKAVEQQIHSSNLKETLTPVIGKKKNRAEIIDVLLRKLHQEVRYTGVEFREAAYVPRAPDEVLKRKYGDCKDKSALLIAMLRSVGIPAYMALLSTGPGVDVHPEMPGFGQFDHAIVYVPGTPEFWIDATSEFSRLGDIPLADQGRLALIAAPDTTSLKMIPDLPSSANRLVEYREIQLAEYGPARVVEVSEPYGAIEARYRHSFRRPEGKNTRKNFERYMEQTYNAEELTAYDCSNSDDFSNRFKLRLEAARAKRANTDLETAAAVITLGSVINRLPQFIRDLDPEPKKSKKPAGSDEEDEDAPKPRKNDLIMFEPFVTEQRYKIVPPPAYRLATLPKAQQQRFGPAILEREYKAEGDGSVSVLIRFDTVKRRYTADEVRSLRDGLKAFYKEKLPVVQFQNTGHLAMVEQRPRDAYRIYQDLAAAHPKEGLHQSQMAQVLLQTGLGEAARSAARKAVELEPQSANAFRTLGYVLRHDLLGRMHHRGFDRDGAIAAFRKAGELEPAEFTHRLNVAILLEFDAEGKRYAPGSKLAEAIQEYRAIRSDIEKTEYIDNLLIALLRAGRYEELLDDISKVPDSTRRKSLRIASIAALKDTEAALREAGEIANNEEERRELVASAAESLFTLRLYPQFTQLLAASAQGSPDAASRLSRSELYMSVKRRETMELSETDPRAIVIRYLQTMLSPEVNPEKWQAIRSELSFSEDSKLHDQQLQGALVGLRAIQAQFDNLENFVDLISARTEFVIDGDERSGYRVGFVFPSEQNQRKVFVIKERGQFRVIDEHRVAALHVLNLAEQGDLQTAALWLDWLREDHELSRGDDPLIARDFASFWTKGKRPGIEDVLTAAAVLAASSPRPERAIPFLERAIKAAGNGRSAELLHATLAEALLLANRYEAAYNAATQVFGRNPGSKSAFSILVTASLANAKWNELAAAATKFSQEGGEEADIARALANSLKLQRKYAAGRDQLRRVIKLGKATADDYNSLSWSYLFDDPQNTEAIDLAQRANTMSKNEAPHILHTAACVFAEKGRIAEAKDLILKVMSLAGEVEPDAASWYVFGVIAKQMGLNEAASAAFVRVESPLHAFELPLSTYELAQRHLTQLNTGASKAAKR